MPLIYSRLNWNAICTLHKSRPSQVLVNAWLKRRIFPTLEFPEDPSARLFVKLSVRMVRSKRLMLRRRLYFMRSTAFPLPEY
jgi:hypothetical protein